MSEIISAFTNRESRVWVLSGCCSFFSSLCMYRPWTSVAYTFVLVLWYTSVKMPLVIHLIGERRGAVFMRVPSQFGFGTPLKESSAGV